MESFIGHALSVFMGFCAIMNPIANTPVFLGLTSDDSPEIRRAVARRALILFQQALLSIWLGKKPPNEGLKIGILSQYTSNGCKL